MTFVTACEGSPAAQRAACHERLHAAQAALDDCYAAARRLVYDVTEADARADWQLSFTQRQALRQLKTAEEWVAQVRAASLRQPSPLR
jgi:hypothetical protein